WLAAAGLDAVRRVAVCLPPRRLGAAAGLLDLPPVVRAVDAYPGLGAPVAHAYLWVVRKP
ncbi:MAG TPA: hypothetical protein VNO23_02565, partial [Candidatus Binatia bacterium]|nr:hypothetical protein [Candidatus Binatia bacterium]